MVMRILIVDDSIETIESLKRAFRLKGHEIIGVLSAQEALILLKTDKDRFDVVLTDYCMPEMNGIDMLQQIRENDIVLPVVMMTAYYDDDLNKKALENQCMAIIQKPFNIDDCEKIIAKAANNPT